MNIFRLGVKIALTDPTCALNQLSIMFEISINLLIRATNKNLILFKSSKVQNFRRDEHVFTKCSIRYISPRIAHRLIRYWHYNPSLHCPHVSFQFLTAQENVFYVVFHYHSKQISVASKSTTRTIILRYLSSSIGLLWPPPLKATWNVVPSSWWSDHRTEKKTQKLCGMASRKLTHFA